ncbi:hypothetical protein V497_02042 [Pseudogymnoascus sp. VKM F-4516 (FW-969)]|nr:hypothetical protein V497_02042 [Pseudogymnoascus sp. VKM F-4516 (FW-969)]
MGSALDSSQNTRIAQREHIPLKINGLLHSLCPYSDSEPHILLDQALPAPRFLPTKPVTLHIVYTSPRSS